MRRHTDGRVACWYGCYNGQRGDHEDVMFFKKF